MHCSKWRWTVLIGLIPFLSTCITPLDVEPVDFQDNLVVQGFIDDDFGPHRIRITRVAKFSGTQDGGSIKRENNVQVRIIDANGVVTILKQLKLIEKRMASGCGLEFVEITTDYRTPEDFKGEIGNSYFLEIITSEDRIYRSTTQLLEPTPPIDSVSLVFKTIPSLNMTAPGSGVEIYASWKEPSETKDYYMWRINGTYKIYTPDRSNPALNFCCPYDPVDGGSEECWIVEKNIEGNDLSFSDFQINGQSATVRVGFIEDNGIRFSDMLFNPASRIYYVEVEQYRISEEAFAFGERIKLLGGINGEIFDPPPVSIRGNITNINDSNERVIGYFGVHAKQKKGTFLSRSLLDFTQLDPKPCGDCRTRAGAQVEIPEPYK